jgi:3-oxoadipate enol-lactonase
VPFARVNDVTHHYQLVGPRHGDGPPIVFINSLGTDFRIWDEVAESLGGRHALLLYDTRGHGLSDTGTPPFGMETLATDLEALLDHLGIPECVLCGVSVGGMIAQHLRALRPGGVRGLILCDTLPRIGDRAMWDSRMARIRDGGIDSVADAILERWFSPSFRTGAVDRYSGYRNMLVRQPVDGYLATCAAIRDADLSVLLPGIKIPTLCLAGDQDGSTPAEQVAAFARKITGASFELIRDCGHLPSIERPHELAAIVGRFMSSLASEKVSHVSQ